MKRDDEYWMSLALAKAEKAKGWTSPNPMVGAVLVRNHQLLATGYHRRAGLPHAEIEALKKVRDPRGATLYVNLEPCCHSDKRTPPCTDAILRSGIKRIVIGSRDPNPQVAGRGVRLLKKAGIRTQAGVLEEECRELNIHYNFWIKKRRPWVLLKVAASLDGLVADPKSRWITGEASRKRVHQLRSQVDGILVGIGTVRSDNPRLTVRGIRGAKQPTRIVLDPDLKISESAKVFSQRPPAPFWIIVKEGRDKTAKAKRIERKGGRVFSCSRLRNGDFDLKILLKKLGREGITSLLVEGGPGVWSSFLEQGCAQEIMFFIAPKILGTKAPFWLREINIRKLFPQLSLFSFEVFGEDVFLNYRLR